MSGSQSELETTEPPGSGGSGSRTLAEIAEAIVVGDRIRWRELLGLFASGLFLWTAGLLSAFINGVYRALAGGISWVIESSYALWMVVPDSLTWVVQEAFAAAGASLDSGYGPLAFVVAVAVVIAWFFALESIVAFLRGWLG